MPILIQSTVSSKKQAKKLAHKLCKNNLAACVQIHKIKSSYFWQDKFCKESEFILNIKSKKKAYKKIVKFMAKNHPYEVPEIIAFKIDRLNKAYKKWLKNSCKNKF